jgi:hypothetical protein
MCKRVIVQYKKYAYIECIQILYCLFENMDFWNVHYCIINGEACCKSSSNAGSWFWGWDLILYTNPIKTRKHTYNTFVIPSNQSQFAEGKRKHNVLRNLSANRFWRFQLKMLDSNWNWNPVELKLYRFNWIMMSPINLTLTLMFHVIITFN